MMKCKCQSSLVQRGMDRLRKIVACLGCHAQFEDVAARGLGSCHRTPRGSDVGIGSSSGGATHDEEEEYEGGGDEGDDDDGAEDDKE
jgi:hypothetical protein